MLVTQLELAHRTHHAVGFDAADRALAQFHAVGWNHRTGQTKNAFHAGSRVRRTAHHLKRIAFPRVDAQHLQLVGIGVLGRGQHFGDPEACELVCRVFDPFDFMSDAIECCGYLGNRGIGVEEVLQPFERELHAFAPTPAERVGWSKGEKP